MVNFSILLSPVTKFEISVKVFVILISTLVLTGVMFNI